MFKIPEMFRVREGKMASDESFGNNGMFIVPLKHQQRLLVLATDGAGWEHVSVSRRDRCPTWEEMCQVKEMFWDDEDCVIQYHPPKSEWVNNHPRCLHMWRPIGIELPRPHPMLVGFKDAGVIA